MPSTKDHDSLNVRARLDATSTPFAVADYGPRELVFVQGDPCDTVLYVESGLVRLAVTTRSGQEAICGLVEAGAFLGEEGLAGHALRRHTATTLIVTRVLVIAKAHALRLLHTHPAIAARFIAHMVARHDRLEADLADQLLHPAEQRIARALLKLAACRDESPCRCLLPTVSQEIIAEMVGTTRSSRERLHGQVQEARIHRRRRRTTRGHAFALAGPQAGRSARTRTAPRGPRQV